MKFVRFGPAGCEKPGILDQEGQVRDLSSIVPDITAGTIEELLNIINDVEVDALPRVSGDVRFGACIAETRNFIAVGLNYADHAAEAGMPVPPEPILFNKAPSCIGGPDDPIVIPRGSEKTDWEVELAVVIGRAASYVDEAETMEHVAGLCVCNDVSERAYQLERGGTWTKGKGCPTFGPLGPWLVTPDEIAIDDLAMTLDVNGERVQNGSTRTMIFRVPYLISYISQFMRLEPGDVITTGTPPGVGMGMTPPRFLKPGDTMRVEIAGLGVQRQRVVAA